MRFIKTLFVVITLGFIIFNIIQFINTPSDRFMDKISDFWNKSKIEVSLMSHSFGENAKENLNYINSLFKYADNLHHPQVRVEEKTRVLNKWAIKLNKENKTDSNNLKSTTSDTRSPRKKKKKGLEQTPSTTNTTSSTNQATSTNSANTNSVKRNKNKDPQIKNTQTYQAKQEETLLQMLSDTLSDLNKNKDKIDTTTAEQITDTLSAIVAKIENQEREQKLIQASAKSISDPELKSLYFLKLAIKKKSQGKTTKNIEKYIKDKEFLDLFHLIDKDDANENWLFDIKKHINQIDEYTKNNSLLNAKKELINLKQKIRLYVNENKI